MIEPTAPLQLAARDAGRLPPVEQVRPLVWSVPVECTAYSIGYTLTYLLANEAGEFLVVDPGWDSPEGRSQLLAGIVDAGLSIDRMRGVVVTHFHHDHRDMADHLHELTGAWVGMHEVEAETTEPPVTVDEAVEIERLWLIECGIPPELAAEYAPDVALESGFPAFRPADKLFRDGDRLPLDGRALSVVFTPGHTAGHLSVRDEDNALFLSGDHVLPRIPPNIGLRATAAADRDSVAEFLGSLEKVKQWDDHEVLPAHEYRFRGLAERATALQDRHLKRQAEVASVLDAAPGTSAWEVAAQVPWTRGWENFDGHNKRLAVGEIVAHVRHYRATH